MLNRFAQLIICLLAVVAGSINIAYAASTQEYVEKANKYIKDGKLKSAVIELKNALQKDPKNATARHLLGETYLRMGDGASAEKELARARDLGVKEEEIEVSMGRAYLLQNKTDEVLNHIQDNKSYPVKTRAQILSLKGQAYVLKNKYTEAKNFYQKANNLDPDSIDAQLGLARLAILDKDLKEAARQSKHLVKVYPKSDEAWALYGEVARMSGNNKDALERFEKALTLAPYNLTALIGKARSNIALGKEDAAIATTDIMLKRYPGYPTTYYIRGVAQFKKHDVDGAENSILKVLNTSPDNIPSLQLIGSIYYIKGQYEQARQALSRVVAAYPSNEYAAKILSATLLKTRQPKQVITLLAPFAAKSRDPQLLSLLGSAYIQDKQNAKGMEILEKASTLAPKEAGIQTQLAMAQLLAGENSRAVEQLESAVDLSPDLVQAEILLTLAHIRNKEYQQAIKTAKRLQKKNDQNPVAYNLMGAAYMGMNKPQEARKQFMAALKVDPKFTVASLNLARLDEKEGNLEGAKTQYKEILKRQPDHVAALLSLAHVLESEGDPKGALTYVLKAYERNPSNVAPGLYLIRYYLKQGDPLNAMSIARSLKDNASDNPQVLKALGAVQIANKQYSNAIQTYQSLSELEPDSPEPDYLMAKAYFAMGKMSSAKSHLQHSLKHNSDYVLAQLAMVDLEVKAGNIKQALTVAKTIQRKHPDSPLGFQVEGGIQLHEKHYNSAISHYKKALAIRKSTEAVTNLSNAYVKAGKKKESISLLEGWLKDNPSDIRVNLLLGSTYQAGKENRKAIARYERVLELDPNNVVSLNNLAWLYHVENNPDALAYAKRAYQMVPGNPAIADTYGWLLVQTGGVKKGLDILRKAADQAPGILDIRYHHAYALHKSGRNKEARRELKTLLDKSTHFSEAGAARKLLAEIDGQ